MSNLGRWPSNVALTPQMAAILDEQSGNRKAGGSKDNRGRPNGVISMDPRTSLRSDVFTSYGDEGGASRFFGQFDYEPEELEWIYSVGLKPYGTE